MAYEILENGEVYVNGVLTHVTINGNLLHAMIRADSKEVFDERALEVGLRYLNGEGVATTPRSVTITEMGPYVKIPAVYEENGDEITPPVLDNRYHVNVWIDLNRGDETLWQYWAPIWTIYGQEADANKNEVAYKYNGIELLDQRTISSPSNILL